MPNTGTGNGMTLTLATTGSIGSLINMGAIAREIPDVPDSTLASTYYEEFIPGDLATVDDIELPVVFDPDVAAGVSLGVPELATVTWPLRAGQTTAATFTATGYLKREEMSGAANNERIEGAYTFKVDGKTTEPTWTAST